MFCFVLLRCPTVLFIFVLSRCLTAKTLCASQHLLSPTQSAHIARCQFPQTPKSRQFNSWLNFQGVQGRCEPWKLRVWQWHFSHRRTNALHWKVSSIFLSKLFYDLLKYVNTSISAAARLSVLTRPTQRCTGIAGMLLFTLSLLLYCWYWYCCIL